MAVQVTVLMSVYNSAAYLREAVESMLAQTFINFEFLIINDASTDQSVSILEDYTDDRIRLVHNKNNLGLAHSLNKGLMLAQGKYVARMDADDVSLPNRLEEQVGFMETHPEIGVCGTWLQLIGSNTDRILKHPANDQSIRTYMFKNNAIGHPSAMIRRKVLIDYNLLYNEKFLLAQDYDFWVRMSMYTRLANIQQVHLLYRIHEKQVSRNKLNEQARFAFQARLPLIERLITKPEMSTAIDDYRKLIVTSEILLVEEVTRICFLLHRIIINNKQKQIYDHAMLTSLLYEQFSHALKRVDRFTISLFIAIQKTVFFSMIPSIERLKLFVKSIIHLL